MIAPAIWCTQPSWREKGTEVGRESSGEEGEKAVEGVAGMVGMTGDRMKEEKEGEEVGEEWKDKM